MVRLPIRILYIAVLTDDAWTGAKRSLIMKYIEEE
jgi:hypothetical protein